MDDESYFTVESAEWIPKYCFNLRNTKPGGNVTYITKPNSVKTVLLRLATSEKRIRDPMFIESGLAGDAYVYNNKYFQICT